MHAVYMYVNFDGKFNVAPTTVRPLLCFSSEISKNVTGFWKTYHLHTNEIIRISDFEPLWHKVTCQKFYFFNYSGN